MLLRPVILFAGLLLLCACGSSGYNRSYIITDSVDEPVVSESIQPR